MPTREELLASQPPQLIRRGMTSDQYLAMPPSSQPQNTVDGDLFVSTFPTDEHERMVDTLYGALRDAAVSSGGQAIRRTDCVLSPTTILQAEVGFIAPGRRAGRHFEGAPELVVEVLSTATADFDTRLKLPAWRQHGVKEIWLVDPAEEFVTLYAEAAAPPVRVNFGQAIPSSVLPVGDARLG